MNCFRKFLVAQFAVVSMCSVLSRPALSQFDALAQHVPAQANALFMVNAEKLFASPVAKSLNWQAQRGKRFDSGLTAIPANATRVLIGSQIDLETMRPTWDAATVEFSTAPTLADIAKHFGGIDDMIGGVPAVFVGDDSYVVKFSDQLLGAFGPGNRQMAARWLQTTDGQLSPYLSEALKYEDEGTEVILAIDATNALSPGVVEQRLAAAKNAELKNSTLSVADITSIVSTLRGIMLGITFGDRPYCRIKIDFAKDATPLSGIAKPLVLGALARHGAMLQEMSAWTVQVKGKTIFLSGYLDESGLMRIASLINLPTHALDTTASGGTASAAGTSTGTSAVSASDPQKLVLDTTLQYFKSIEKLMQDLRSQKGEDNSIFQIGFWFSYLR